MSQVSSSIRRESFAADGNRPGATRVPSAQEDLSGVKAQSQVRVIPLQEETARPGSDSLSALEDFIALRATVGADARRHFSISHDPDTGAFVCKAGEKLLGSHILGPMNPGSQRYLATLLRNLDAFEDPIATFCALKEACADDPNGQFTCTVSPGRGQTQNLSLHYNQETVLGHRPATATDLERLARHGIALRDPDGRLGAAGLSRPTPPASPLDGIQLRSLLPGRIAIPVLPKSERTSSGSAWSYFSGALYALKDRVVGKWDDPFFGPMSDRLAALNRVLDALSGRFETLYHRAADLGAPPDVIASDLEATASILRQAQEALSALLIETERACQREDASEAVLKVTGEGRHIAAQLASLNHALEALQDAEAGERGRWREALKGLRAQIADNRLLKGQQFQTRDLLWLVPFRQALATVGRSTDRVAEQPDRQGVIRALSSVIRDGVKMPDNIDKAIALLAAFHPETGVVDHDPAPMPPVEDFARDPLIPVSEDQRRAYEEIVAGRAAVIRQRDGELRYHRLMLEASRQAEVELSGALQARQGDSVTQRALSERVQRVDELKAYYALVWRDEGQPDVESERANFNTLHPVMSRESLAVIERRFHPGAEQAQNRGSAIEQDQIIDGTLMLLAQTDGWVVKRDELILETATRPEPEALALMRGAEDAYNALDTAARAELTALASAYLQRNHELHYYTQGEGLKIEGVNFSRKAVFEDATGLLGQFVKYPAQHIQLLTERDARLQASASALQALLDKLPANRTDELRQPLEMQLAEFRVEREMLGRVLSASVPLEPLQQLKTAEESQKALHVRLEALNKSLEAPLLARLTKLNVAAYQLRTESLIDNISETTEIARALRPKQADFAALKRNLEALGKPVLVEPTGRPNADQIRAARLYKEIAEAEEQLTQLGSAFRVGLLELQREEERAKSPGGGGYPEQIYWSSWVAQLAGEQVTRASGAHRESPRSLMLQQQLALTGKSMIEAYQEFGAILKEPLTASHRLGLTSENLLKWKAAYPEQMIQLTSNFTHVARALSANSITVTGNIAEMIGTTWDRATAESFMRDALLGRRTSIVGAVQAEPMPAPLIALLSAAEWAPYVTGALAGMTAGNVGGSAAALVAAGLGANIVGAAGVAVLGALGGVAQVQAEKHIAQELTKYRKLNVTVNAVLRGMRLDSTASIADRLKEMGAYAAQRQALREIGTIQADLAEVGKAGFIKRYADETALIWKQANVTQKLLLAVSAAAVPIAIGAAVLVMLTPLGVPLMLAAAVTAALLSTASTRAVWATVAEWFGIDAQKEVNRQRMDAMIDEAKRRLAQSMAAKKVTVIENGSPVPIRIDAQIEHAVAELAPQLKAIGHRILDANPRASAAKLAGLFVAEASQCSTAAPLAVSQATLDQILGESGDPAEARQLIAATEKTLNEQISVT